MKATKLLYTERTLVASDNSRLAMDVSMTKSIPQITESGT
jgi:hypothetical protein